MSKRTFTLIFTLFTVAVILVMIAIYNPSYDYSPTITSSAPTEKPESLIQAELKFGNLSSFPFVSSSGEQILYSIPITISANRNKITAVQLEISYDPQALMQISLIPGTFFQKPVSLLNEKNENNGRISYAIGTSPNNSGIEGKGIVAILRFQTKSQFRGITTISFLPKTSVIAKGSNQSVLKKRTSAKIVIGDNIASISGNIDN